MSHRRSWSERSGSTTSRDNSACGKPWHFFSFVDECSPRLPPVEHRTGRLIHLRTVFLLVSFVIALLLAAIITRGIFLQTVNDALFLSEQRQVDHILRGKAYHSDQRVFNKPSAKNATFDHQVRVIYAILTVAEKTEIRNAIRTSYRQMLTADDKYKHDLAEFIFVIGAPANKADFNAHYELLKYESEQYQDILLLNVTENMNNGKTFETFRAIHQANYFGIDAQYIFKMDDDTVMHIPRTIDFLREHSLTVEKDQDPSLYLGMELLFENARQGDLGTGNACGANYGATELPLGYASGSAYALGRKEVEWIASEEAMAVWTNNFPLWECKHEDVNMGVLLALNPQPTFLQHEWRLWWRLPLSDDQEEWGEVFCWHWAKTIEQWLEIAVVFINDLKASAQRHLRTKGIAFIKALSMFFSLHDQLLGSAPLVMACALRDPAEKAAFINDLEDQITSARETVLELLKDDAALHRELEREKANGDNTDHYAALDNHVHCLLYKTNNIITELRDAKRQLTGEIDVEFDQFSEPQIEKELEQGKLLEPAI